MPQQAMNIPNELYYVVGFLILTNIGTIISFIVAGLKAAWFVSKMDSRIKRAHERIDEIVDTDKAKRQKSDE